MSSRDKILAAVKQNQPEAAALPSLEGLSDNMPGTLEAYRKILEGLGGSLFEITDEREIPALLAQHYPDLKRIITATDLQRAWVNEDPHLLDDVDMAIVPGLWGVAENGSVWLTEEQLQVRVLPFICQHLAVVIDAGQIVPTMHEAYDRLQDLDYDFGSFIAGPSKTADIEQSLVIGAHGPRSMTVFLMES